MFPLSFRTCLRSHQFLLCRLSLPLSFRCSGFSRQCSLVQLSHASNDPAACHSNFQHFPALTTTSFPLAEAPLPWVSFKQLKCCGSCNMPFSGTRIEWKTACEVYRCQCACSDQEQNARTKTRSNRDQIHALLLLERDGLSQVLCFLVWGVIYSTKLLWTCALLCLFFLVGENSRLVWVNFQFHFFDTLLEVCSSSF